MRRYPLNQLLEATGLSLAQLNARIRMGGDTYRRAQVEGRAFTTPFPKTAGDIEHELWLATEAA